MKPEPWQVHVFGLGCIIQAGKNPLDLGERDWRNTSSISLLEQARKTLVALPMEEPNPSFVAPLVDSSEAGHTFVTDVEGSVA